MIIVIEPVYVELLNTNNCFLLHRVNDHIA